MTTTAQPASNGSTDTGKKSVPVQREHGMTRLARGVAWLLSETGVPRRIKTAFLTDTDIKDLAAYAASLRGTEQAA
jgi:hypothetical protein